MAPKNEGANAKLKWLSEACGPSTGWTDFKRGQNALRRRCLVEQAGAETWSRRNSSVTASFYATSPTLSTEVRMASAPTPSLIPVLTEHAHALGHLLARGKLGWECFDDCDVSLGTFPTADE